MDNVNNKQFYGYINDFRMYNKELETKQITHIYKKKWLYEPWLNVFKNYIKLTNNSYYRPVSDIYTWIRVNNIQEQEYVPYNNNKIKKIIYDKTTNFTEYSELKLSHTDFTQEEIRNFESEIETYNYITIKRYYRNVSNGLIWEEIDDIPTEGIPLNFEYDEICLSTLNFIDWMYFNKNQDALKTNDADKKMVVNSSSLKLRYNNGIDVKYISENVVNTSNDSEYPHVYLQNNNVLTTPEYIKTMVWEYEFVTPSATPANIITNSKLKEHININIGLTWEYNQDTNTKNEDIKIRKGITWKYQDYISTTWKNVATQPSGTDIVHESELVNNINDLGILLSSKAYQLNDEYDVINIEKYYISTNQLVADNYILYEGIYYQIITGLVDDEDKEKYNKIIDATTKITNNINEFLIDLCKWSDGPLSSTNPYYEKTFQEFDSYNMHDSDLEIGNYIQVGYIWQNVATQPSGTEIANVSANENNITPLLSILDAGSVDGIYNIHDMAPYNISESQLAIGNYISSTENEGTYYKLINAQEYYVKILFKLEDEKFDYLSKILDNHYGNMESTKTTKEILNLSKEQYINIESENLHYGYWFEKTSNWFYKISGEFILSNSEYDNYEIKNSLNNINETDSNIIHIKINETEYFKTKLDKKSYNILPNDVYSPLLYKGENQGIAESKQFVGDIGGGYCVWVRNSSLYKKTTTQYQLDKMYDINGQFSIGPYGIEIDSRLPYKSNNTNYLKPKIEFVKNQEKKKYYMKWDFDLFPTNYQELLDNKFPDSINPYKNYYPTLRKMNFKLNNKFKNVKLLLVSNKDYVEFENITLEAGNYEVDYDCKNNNTIFSIINNDNYSKENHGSDDNITYISERIGDTHEDINYLNMVASSDSKYYHSNDIDNKILKFTNIGANINIDDNNLKLLLFYFLDYNTIKAT